MARVRGRVAVGTAMVAAVITVGGPGIATAPADPGHGSHRDRGDGDRRGGGGSHRDGGGSRHDSRNGDNRGRDGRDRDDRRRGGYGNNGGGNNSGGRGHDGWSGNGRPGKDDGGWSDRDRPGSQWVEEEDDSEIESPAPVARSSSGTSSAARGVTSESVGAQSVDEPATPAAPATPSGPEVVAGGGGGATPSGGPVAITPPAVVFGNGRTPGVLTGGPMPAGAPAASAALPEQAPVVPAAPVAPEPLTPIAIAPTAPSTIPDVGRESQLPRVISEIWTPVGPSSSNNAALWGLAGLILIPLAGIWLGHRQAAAARRAAILVDN